MQINYVAISEIQSSITKEISKKVLEILSVHKPFFSERYPLFSECKSSVNQMKITLKLTKKKPSWSESNQILQRLSLEQQITEK